MSLSRPRPVRNVFFVDGQNLYHRCREHFGEPWVHPLRLAEVLVEEDRQKYGADSHVLTAVRFYTGIHDPNRRPHEHRVMERRLMAYRRQGIHVEDIPLRYNAEARGVEKGIDVRIALDLMRLATKGLFDVATIVSEDSDLNEAVRDVLALRDDERWISVSNAQPWSSQSHTRWLPLAPRKRPIRRELFERVRDTTVY